VRHIKGGYLYFTDGLSVYIMLTRIYSTSLRLFTSSTAGRDFECIADAKLDPVCAISSFYGTHHMV
jgi:hypothetical protein